MRLTLPDGFAGSIVATGDWSIGNHACAPKNPVSGAYREEPAHVPATMRREGSTYVLSVMSDQFVADACHWVFTGLSVKFYEGGKLVGIAGVDKYLLKERSGRLQIMCHADPQVPYCVTPEVAHQTFLKKWPNAKAFSFTIEGI